MYTDDRPREPLDVDAALYEGFLSDADRSRCSKVMTAVLAGEPAPHVEFDDPRIGPLIFRMRARRSARLMDSGEQAQWQRDVAVRLTSPGAPWVTLDRFDAGVAGMQESNRDSLSAALQRHAEQLRRWLGPLPDSNSVSP
jgi:exodeoxyribonuclease-1